MKLVVGLGNPGKEYEWTRHNMGFLAIDNFARSLDGEINKEKFDGLYEIFDINGDKVMLMKPLSYMNLSGTVVKKYIDYFKIDISDILIISDDLDMDFARIKLKYKGSCGGHNGLRNIEENIGTSVYKRLKIGISNNKNIDTKDYVLSKFNSSEKDEISNLLITTNKILSDYLKFDFEVLMSKYN